MGIGAPGPHLRRDPDRLHQFLAPSALAQRSLGVTLDAVWALRHMRDRYCNELLGLGRQRAIREHLLAERLEGIVDFGGESLTGFGQVSRGQGIQRIRHDNRSPEGGAPIRPQSTDADRDAASYLTEVAGDPLACRRLDPAVPHVSVMP